MCKAFGDPELAGDASFATNTLRVANRDEVDGRVQAHLGRFGREEAAALLDGARIAYGRLSDMEDVAKHPQSRFTPVATPNGMLELLSPAALVSGDPEFAFGSVPALDEHGAAIRAEFADPN